MSNIAIVGFGFMGMTHAVNILKNQKLKLVAIVDKDLAGIDKKLSAQTGNFSMDSIDPSQLDSISKYEDVESCLAKEKIDAVHVCVHTDQHYTFAKQLLSKGLNVFLEKPMTLNVEEGHELVDLSRKNKAVFMVGHVVRFMSPYQKLKKWVDERTYGPLKFLSLSRFSGLPSWGQWKDKQKAFGSSGGALFDLLIHDIDYVQYLLGIPDEISSQVFPGALSEHDYINAFWKYHHSDVKVKLEGGNIFHSKFPFHAGYIANFEHVSVMYTTLKPEVIQVATNEDMLHIKAEEDFDGFYNEINYFYQCIESGKSPDWCLPESSLETIKLCHQHLNSIHKDLTF